MKAKKTVKRLQNGPSSSDQSSNRLLIRLLKEMKEEAAANKHPTHIYENMMTSVKKYKNELTTAEELLQVKGIGKKTCERLVNKMKEYKETGDVGMSSEEDNEQVIENKKPKRKVAVDDEENRAGPSGEKTVPKVSKNDPKQVKVNLNDIIILSILDSRKESLTKISIVSEAEKYCDYLLEGHTEETCDKSTLWPAMLTLLEKKFVDKKSYQYKLTDLGANFIHQRQTENPANSKFENILLKKALEEPDEKNKTIFNEALTSLQRCPIALKSAKDCRRLLNFDRHICSLLDQLDINKKLNKLPLDDHDEGEEEKTDTEEEDTNMNTNANKVVQPPAKGRTRAATKDKNNQNEIDFEKEKDQVAHRPARVKRAQATENHKDRQDHLGMEIEDENNQVSEDEVDLPRKTKTQIASTLEYDEESDSEREINMDINPPPIRGAKHRQDTDESDKENDLTMDLEYGGGHVNSTMSLL